jgi:hypothetical protein
VEEDELLGPVVANCLLDMKKAGARTTWSGWFPRSFGNLLSEFDIPPDEAVNTAKSVRSIITNGMDEIWRERNSVQHDPNARLDINPKIDSAHERKLQLGLDNGPHATSSDVKKLPVKCLCYRHAHCEQSMSETHVHDVHREHWQ